MVRDVVEAAAQSPIASEEMKTFFKLQIHGVIGGKTKSARGIAGSDFSLIGGREERQPGAGFRGIDHVEFVNDGKLEKRHNPPSDEAIGSVPWIRTGQLRDIQTEIEHLVGMRAGASESAEDFIVLAKTVAQSDLKGVVAVVAAVLEQEVAVHRALESVVGEAMHPALFEEFQFQEDRSRKLFLEAEAP